MSTDSPKDLPAPTPSDRTDVPTPPPIPLWAQEPPEPPAEGLVPGSRYHDEQWIMAARMLAQGSTFLQVARSLKCSRTTLWRAYYKSQPFRIRIWWERQLLNREAQLRLRSLRGMVAEQVERLVSAGDPATIRWAADRLGLLATHDAEDREPGAFRERTPPDADIVRRVIDQPESDGPAGHAPWTVIAGNDFPDLGDLPAPPHSRFRLDN